MSWVGIIAAGRRRGLRRRLHAGVKTPRQDANLLGHLRRSQFGVELFHELLQYYLFVLEVLSEVPRVRIHNLHPQIRDVGAERFSQDRRFLWWLR